MRDLRIAMIYEGTNHIQALDLVGRKLRINQGRLIMNLQKRSPHHSLHWPLTHKWLKCTALQKAFQTLTELTMYLAKEARQDPELIGAVASEYLNVFGFAMFAFSWAPPVQPRWVKAMLLLKPS